MQLSDLVGGKASGIVTLAGLGLPIPVTSIVSQLPSGFPAIGSDRVIIRPSEPGGGHSDPLVAQAASGSLHSAIADERSWDESRRMYDDTDDRIAAYVLQPYVGYTLGIMGHTNVRRGKTYIAVASSLAELTDGDEAMFEAVLIADGNRTFAQATTLPSDVETLVAELHQNLPRLSEWPTAEVVEWEAAYCESGIIFLQCQASTAEIPDWSRP